MSRQAQLVFALAGLWGGAFAWNRAAMPRQERVARLTHTGAPAAAPELPLAWPDRVRPARDDRKVVRDLFATPATVRAATPEVSATPLPTPQAPTLRYVGFVADGSGRKVLLSGVDGIRAASEGDVLSGGWRLERIEAEQVVLRDMVTGTEATVPRDR